MKKGTIIALCIAVAAIAAFLIYKNSSNFTGTLVDNEFAYEGTEQIIRIDLKGKDGEEAILTLKDGDWWVNDKYKAREAAIKNIQKVAKDITVNYPVSKAGHNNIMNEFMSKSVRIAYYTDANDDPVKIYHMAGSTPTGIGSYTIMEDKNGNMAKQAYVCYLRNFEGHLHERFFTNEEEWRSRRVFDYSVDEMQSITIDYLGRPQESFTISKGSSNWEIKPVNNLNATDLPAVQPRVDEYVSYFSDLSIEAFENNYPGRDSIVEGTPFCRITITENDDNENVTEIFYRPTDKRSKAQFDENGQPIKIDVDRYFALVNNKEDFATIQQYVFGKLFRSYQDFVAVTS